MRFLARRAGKKTVRGIGAKDEFLAKDLAEYFHHQRVLNHVDKHLALVQQVPDAALEVDLVLMPAMEVRCCLHTVGMRVDDAIGLGNLGFRENALDKVISGTGQQRLDGGVGMLVPVLCGLCHVSIHSCAGSFLNFHTRFGPAMTLR